MKMTLISTVSSWLCATGVAVVASYSFLTSHPDTPNGQKQAAKVAARISKQQTIRNYRPNNRHSSVIRKTTTAKVTQKDFKKPTFVPNPIHPAFTNALNRLTDEVAAMTRRGDVVLNHGFILIRRAGKLSLRFPEAYERVGIGGLAIGDELKNGWFGVCTESVGGFRQKKITEVVLCSHKRLPEPEFYCTEVTYSALPVTKQIDAIRMYGYLNISSATKASRIVKEIAQWMKEDYGAVDLRAGVPADMLASKKLRIGKGMDVDISVKWKTCQKAGLGNARIDISFTTRELADDNQYQSRELGLATDAARLRTYRDTGVNYFTVRPKVSSESVKNKVVY